MMVGKVVVEIAANKFRAAFCLLFITHQRHGQFHWIPARDFENHTRSSSGAS